MDYQMDPRINRELLEEAARGIRRIMQEGFTPSRGGDISIRDRNTGLIYISGTMDTMPFDYNSFMDFRAQDTVVFDLDGNKLTPWNSATIETPLHLSIFRARPEINCVLHIHPLWSSIFAIARQNIPLILVEQYAYLGGEIECAEYAPAGDLRVGEYTAKALGEKNAAIMASHGAVTVGETVDMAFRNAHFLENIAQKAVFASMLGDLHTISPEEALADHFMPGTK